MMTNAIDTAAKPNISSATMIVDTPSVTTGAMPLLSIHRPAYRATRMPAAPGMPISPAIAGPYPCVARSIAAIVAQNPP